jgi:hypothetical protein
MATAAGSTPWLTALGADPMAAAPGSRAPSLEAIMSPMTNAPSAIQLARLGEGWRWRLVNDQGRIAAFGWALQQQDAMAAAWRVARAWAGAAKRYPEIIVEHPTASCRRPRRYSARRREPCPPRADRPVRRRKPAGPPSAGARQPRP